MLKRILRSLITFAAIIAVYQAYVLFAVPWMEPPLSARRTTRVSQGELERAEQTVTKYQRLLSNYFPAGHWTQTKPPKVIASSNEQAMLVLDDYQRHDDDQSAAAGGMKAPWIEIERFALLVFPTPLREGIAPSRDAIVLEAPQGAKLEFDEFRPEFGKIGRITRGEFPGRITIRSDMREPGPEDDLLVETADLAMNTRLLYTTSPVRFRLGANVGGGQEMEIRFLPDDGAEPQDSGLKIAGIDALEVRRDVRLRLFLESDSLLPGDEKSPRAPRGSKAERGNEKPKPPVEVTCSGPFHFDFVRYVASFDRDVELRQLSASGPSDQVSAQQLDVHFAPRQAPGAAGELVMVDPAKRQQRDLGRLEPATIVAQGHPVVVISPTRNVEARGGRVELGLRDQRVVVSGGSDVRLIYGSNVLRAPAIEYQHPPSEAATRIGRFRAAGPGSLDYVFDPAKPEQIFRATWQTGVELGRHEDQPMLTLTGRPQLGVAKMGALEADRIQVHLRELEAGAAGSVPLPGDMGRDGKLQIAPDRLLASGRVEIESVQLTGNTEELLVAFRTEPEPGAAGATDLRTSTPVAGESRSVTERLNLAETGQRPTETYHIDTDRLQIQVAVRGQRMSPTNLSCDGNVVFREIPWGVTAEKPLEVRGGRLTVDNLDADMHVTILGDSNGTRLAQVAARGMTLLADTVQLDERENRLWIDGPGKANMLVSRDLGGRPAATPFPLEITWQGGLNFNGQLVVLDRDVLVQGADDWVRCERLTARLTTPVKFGEHIDQKTVDLAEVECRGHVMLDHRSRDEQGLSSHEWMRLARLTINQQTGAISGDGPGEIRSTHFASQFSNLTGPAGGAAATRVTPPRGAGGSKLQFLRVDFQRELDGNLYTRMVKFADRVRAVYGPVDSWEQELDGSQPDELPLESMTLLCDELSLNEDPQATRAATSSNQLSDQKMGPVQLRANGNVRIAGQSSSQGKFGAEAETASYEQSKDVFTLAGSVRTPAMLWQRRSPDDNSPPYYAQRIRYERSTGQVSGRMHSLEFAPASKPGNARGPAPLLR